MSRRQPSRHGTDKNSEMNRTKADVSDLWIQHQRRNTKTTQSWACIYCPDRKICLSKTDLWSHAEKAHPDKIPAGEDELIRFRKAFESDSVLKRLVNPLTIVSGGGEICKAVLCLLNEK